MGESEGDAEPTIRYVQKLGHQYLDLILEASKWVFAVAGVSDGPLLRRALEIFTADLSTVESLPRLAVMGFLEREHPTGCRLYLEHLISHAQETSNEIHEKLIHIYITEVRRLRTAGEEGTFSLVILLPFSFLFLKQNKNRRARLIVLLFWLCSIDRAKEIYDQLLQHLIQSQSYSPNWVLGRLPAEEMLEARALTLGRIGQHEAALMIYVHRLGELNMAEEL